MKRYIWCCPVKSGKTQQLMQSWREEMERRKDPSYRNEIESLFEAIGLHNWDMWIQHTHKGDYFLNLVEVDNWNEFWDQFREQIQEGVPHAQHLQKLWLDVLGIDLSSKKPVAEPELVGEHQFNQLPQERTMCHAFCYPIKEGREKGRHAFQKLVETSKAQEMEQAAKEMGLCEVARYLHKTKDGTFYIVYQEFDRDQHDKVIDFLTNPATQHRHEWLWEGLVEDTGWSIEELQPNIEYMKSKPQLSRR
jgi:hypothetical protein